MAQPSPTGETRAGHLVPNRSIFRIDCCCHAKLRVGARPPRVRRSPKITFTAGATPARRMPTERALEDFIADTFVSVWTLELLSLLLDSSGSRFSQAELVERMRASDAVVSQGVSALVSAGIAIVDERGCVDFRPINPELEDCARQAVDFYRKFPGRARRLIISRSAPGLAAFADAFRLRKE